MGAMTPASEDIADGAAEGVCLESATCLGGGCGIDSGRIRLSI